jgi:hypothetical protein
MEIFQVMPKFNWYENDDLDYDFNDLEERKQLRKMKNHDDIEEVGYKNNNKNKFNRKLRREKKYNVQNKF